MIGFLRGPPPTIFFPQKGPPPRPLERKKGGLNGTFTKVPFFLPKGTATTQKSDGVVALSRGLDSDLQVLAKAGEPFDWERVSFVLEACGV